MTPESARVRRDYDGRWVCRPYLGTDRVTGRRVRPYHCWPASLTEEEAQRACDAWLATIAPGETGIVSRRLGSMLADYVEDPLNGFAGNTRATYMSVVRTCVEPTIGNIPYDELRAHEVREAYRSLLRGRPGRDALSPTTVQKMHTLLKGAYSRWSRAMAGRNPMRDVAPPRLKPTEPFALDEADRDALSRALASAMAVRGAAPGDVSRRTVAFAAYLALHGGFRCGEVCALRRGDWRRDQHDMHVAGTVVEHPALERQSWPKGKRAGNVSLPPSVEHEILSHEMWQDGWLNRVTASTPLVTLSPRGAIVRPSTLSARFSALARELGLPEGTTFHTLRHTHATWLLMHGFDMRTVQERLRHADVATTLRVYGSVMPGRDAAAAVAFTDSVVTDLEGKEGERG